MIQLKTEYIKIIENNPMKKARLVTIRRSEDEYEIVEFDIPKEYRNKGIEDELLKEVTDDADNEEVVLYADISKITSKKDR